MFGQSVTFTATVTVAGAGCGHGDRDGDVHGRRDDAGHGHPQRRCRDLHDLDAVGGPSHVTAVYGGDASFNGSTSNTVDQEVQKADTTTALTSSANPSKFGQSVTFTATVAVLAPGRARRPGRSRSSTARRRWARARSTQRRRDVHDRDAVGRPSLVTAVYGGDASFNASTSNSVDQEVQKATRPRRVARQPVEVRPVGDVHGHRQRRGAGSRHADRDGDVHGRRDDAGHGHAQRRRRDVHDVDAVRWAITTSRRSTAVTRASTRARRTPSTRRCRSGHRDRAHVLDESVDVRPVGDVHGDGDGASRRGGHGDRDGDVHRRRDDAGHGHAQRRRASRPSRPRRCRSGHHNVTAVYGGDANFTASTSTPCRPVKSRRRTRPRCSRPRQIRRCSGSR